METRTATKMRKSWGGPGGGESSIQNRCFKEVVRLREGFKALEGPGRNGNQQVKGLIIWYYSCCCNGIWQEQPKKENYLVTQHQRELVGCDGERKCGGTSGSIHMAV